MTIVPFACAEFHDAAGNVLYKIGRHQLRLMIENVPDSIRQDPLFDMMVREGSIRVPETAAEKKVLENDPDSLAPKIKYFEAFEQPEAAQPDAANMKAQEETNDTGSAAPAEEASLPSPSAGEGASGSSVGMGQGRGSARKSAEKK